MITSKLTLIWASNPECSRPVAEVWIGENELWFTIFIDDNDDKLKFELLPRSCNAVTYLVDFTEAERLIVSAKSELMAMSSPSE